MAEEFQFYPEEFQQQADIYLAVVGSRVLADHPEAQLLLEAVIGEAWDRADRLGVKLVIVSGRASGIDTMAEQTALQCSLGRALYPINGQGIQAIEARNWEIARRCTELVAITAVNARTHGAAWTARLARKLQKPVREYEV